ncbi:MAG: aminopeptidase N [Rhodospirillaceae bacterium]
MDSSSAPAAPKIIRLDDYTPPAYRIGSVALEFDLAPHATRVKATMTLEAAHDRAKGVQPLELDGEGLKVLSVLIEGKPAAAGSYTVTGQGLTIPLPPASFTLETEVEIDPAGNKALEGLYQSRGNYCTQCEAEGFRHITFFPDRPDVMTTFTTTIRAPKDTAPVLLSNGNLTDSGGLPDGRHYAVWADPFPKPCYLFALVAGDLGHIEDHFKTMSGRDVRLRIYVEHGKEPRAGYAMEALKRSMAWDEKAFGREYDLDIFNIVAVSDFNMGAMENKSLNIFNDRYILADSETATDMDYYLIESIVGHEYFHNWSGNRVTCRDWFQLSLKEGFTVFRDQEFTADVRSRANKRIDDVEVLRVTQFREDAGPLAHPVRPDSYMEINNFYTSTVYQKGAEVIRMMHTLLGPEKFRAACDLYFARHDGQAVTCDDFVAAMEDSSGVDLTQFKLWYRQAGTPTVSAQGAYDASARTFTLALKQSCPVTPGQPLKQPMHIPFQVGLVGENGADMPLELEGDGAKATTKVLELTKPEQTFVFKNVSARPRPSLNRGFGAPVIVDFAQDDADRAFLVGHDTDSFNRWDAAQDYGATVILRGVEALQAGKPIVTDQGYIKAMGAVVADTGIEPAFKASLLNLPAEDYLANKMAVEDPINLHAARKALRRALGETYRAQFQAIYDGQRVNAPYVPDAAGMGRRLLKRMALAYLAAHESPDTTALVKAQFDSADNMTDRMDALGILNWLDVPERESALAAFYDRFKDDHLVVNKWLTVQASAPLKGTLATVERLMGHTAFDIKNPNKVRAVIGAFAAANPVNFHAADGSGYRFLADQIMAIDSFNPQTAARLVPPLGRWKRLDPARQTLMRGELDRMAASGKLSRDVTELVLKSLAP